jgi:hypothetical protein
MEIAREINHKRLALYGVLLFLLSLGVGFMLRDAQDSELTPPEIVRRWRIAHMSALLHGLLLIGVAGALVFIRLTRSQLRFASWAMIAGAAGASIGAIVAAVYNVDGRVWQPPIANRVAFILLGIGVLGVLFGIATIAWRGAWDAIRSWLRDGRWHNWARTVTARPARIERPTTPAELENAVREARRDRLPIRAVGAGYSWSPMAATPGVMIDMSELNAPITFDITSTPPTVTVRAGMTVRELTDYAGLHGLTLATTTVIPWVQVGGALAMGAHGTGMQHSHFTDLVNEIKLVDAGGNDRTYTRAATPEWRALLVGLGALGIVYEVTFDCVPMFNVEVIDTKQDMLATISDMENIVGSKPYVEIFWYPFNKRCWVKTWEPTQAPANTGWTATRDFRQWFQTKILGPPLLHLLSFFPIATPLVTKILFALIREQTRVLRAPDALQYQTSFMKVFDVGYAIPIDGNWDKAKEAWGCVVARLEALAKQRIYPQNLVLHTRFVRSGDALLAPSSRNPKTCYIEILSFHNTPLWEAYREVVERDWLALDGKPHWGKMYNPARATENYQQADIDAFLQVRNALDPDQVFVNDHLREIFPKLGP